MNETDGLTESCEAEADKARAEKAMHQANLKDQMYDFAFQQKAYYDALLEVGFHEEDAKEIFMKSIVGVPYVYSGFFGSSLNNTYLT